MGDALAAVRRGDWARCDGWEWEEGGGDRICGRGETRTWTGRVDGKIFGVNMGWMDGCISIVLPFF